MHGRWRPWPALFVYAYAMDGTGVDVLEGMGSIESCHIFISNSPGDVRPGSAGTHVEGYEAGSSTSMAATSPRGSPGG